MAYKEEDKIFKDSIEGQKKKREEEFKERINNVKLYTQAISTAIQEVVRIFQTVSDLRKQELKQDTKERQVKLDSDLIALNDAK